MKTANVPVVILSNHKREQLSRGPSAGALDYLSNQHAGSPFEQASKRWRRIVGRGCALRTIGFFTEFRFRRCSPAVRSRCDCGLGRGTRGGTALPVGLGGWGGLLWDDRWLIRFDLHSLLQQHYTGPTRTTRIVPRNEYRDFHLRTHFVSLSDDTR